MENVYGVAVESRKDTESRMNKPFLLLVWVLFQERMKKKDEDELEEDT